MAGDVSYVGQWLRSGCCWAGCEGRFSADLATDAPADTAITSVQVNLLGLQFRTADGATATLQFGAGELVDLFDLRVGDPLRLFTSEQLPAGTYTGHTSALRRKPGCECSHDERRRVSVAAR